MGLSTIILPVLLISSLSGVHPLIGYDCEAEHINKTTISLVETPECEIQAPNITTISQTVVVTQTMTVQEVPFIRCLVVAYNHIWYCGKTIDTQAEAGYYSSVIDVTSDECRRMIEDRIYIYRLGNLRHITLDKGGRMSVSFTSWGSIRRDSCEPGGALEANGRSYDRHTQNTRLELIYGTGAARLDIEQKSLMMPNGMRCEVGLERCELADYGIVFWKQPVPECTSMAKDQAVIFQGFANVTTNHARAETFVTVKDGGHLFQIKLETRTTEICGYKSYYTEHPKLYITLIAGGPPFPLKKVEGLDVDMSSYVNSKLVFSMRHTKSQVDQLFSVFNHQRCMMENRITSNMMTLALTSPREFAYQYFGEPGYTAVVRGEVVHVAKCRPVPVIPIPTPLCYNELPVQHNNKTFFLSPRTKILLRMGTIIDCFPDLGSQFKISNKWVTMTSAGLMAVPRPQVITPEPLNYEFEEMKDLSSGGLYTAETLWKYQKILTSPIEEKVLTSRIVSALKGETDLPEGYSMSNTFTHSDYSIITEVIGDGWSRIWGGVKSFGHWAAIGFGIWHSFGLLRSIINCAFTYVSLRDGLKWWAALLGCCCSSAATLISSGRIYRQLRRKTPRVPPRANTNVAQIEETAAFDMTPILRGDPAYITVVDAQPGR
uniref:Glycoprotein n=1 Tax=Guadeloupe mosquito mononega-like virus TaxID=2607732 RepID=A0A5C1K3G4_9MONO|nr:glycoprotein [Guadeloupe mosquito mononega-like virus]